MNYQEIIESKYNRESWQQLLSDIFSSKVKFWRAPSDVSVSARIAKKAMLLGKISLSDGESIAVYEVELNDNVDVQRNKSSIRNMLTKDWKDMGHAGAFVFAYRKNENIFRFSYISETWAFNKQGEYEKVSTDTTRYTYLLGVENGCRTAVDQFTKLRMSNQTLRDITDAFSVESLTKRFYSDLFDWYLWALEPKSGISFPDLTTSKRDERDDIEQKIIRLITRLMFVWFIKQKKLVPDKLFEEEFLNKTLRNFKPLDSKDGSYYNAILQNLFFATLNRAIVDEDGKRRVFAKKDEDNIKTLYRYAEKFNLSEQEVIELFAEIPFLNGGLFECLDKKKGIDGVSEDYSFDGFSQDDSRLPNGNYRYRAVVPNLLFFDPERGLFSILKRYNFTIEENTPNEQQIALDPELLGKVFENLLGAYNPETKETVRNMSGSFYTPREIVSYMVDESLIAYLGDNEFNRSLFSQNFKYEEASKKDYQAVATKLREVKVIDPACGSGAFPMGLLNRMVEVLQRIVPGEKSYDQKLFIIENCLYGSDIQSIASQITKLRFFISLICDCEKDVSKPNFAIPTLPNLETKFVTADSLLTVKRKVVGDLFEDPEIEATEEQLRNIRRRHFEAKSSAVKHKLRREDSQLRTKLINLLEQNNDCDSDEARQLASWNPYDQNSVSSFFDPEWMFGLTEGFDIVIGNPPYIQLQSNEGRLANLYAKEEYKTFDRKGDIYCLFYERGQRLLKEGGHLCFITSNKWMRAGYGQKTRDFFVKETNPMLLLDFSGVKVFESATVDTNILLFAKGKNQHKTICATASKKNENSVKNLSIFVKQNATLGPFDTPDPWTILSPIELSIKRKVEEVGVPLKAWDVNISRGVLTGCNEAFVISTEKRNEILACCKTSDELRQTEELIRPILRGRDIKRYSCEWKDLWLINVHNGIKGILKAVNIEDYPAVKKWLDDGGVAYNGKRYKGFSQLSKRSDQGDTPYNLRSCAYLDDFSRPKIMYPNMTKFLPFYLDTKGYYQNDKSFLITGKHLAFLTAFLNSSLFKFCYIDNFPELQGGTRELRKIFFDKIKVIQIDDSMEQAFKGLVSEMQKQPSKTTAQKIDDLLFDIYELTKEERELVGFIEIE